MGTKGDAVYRQTDESLSKIMEEKDFREIFDRKIAGLFRIHNFVLAQAPAVPLSKRFYSCLMEESRELKNSLDDFEARSNRRYSFFTEIILSVVSFSAAGYLVKHLLTRYPRYGLRDERPVYVAYHEKAQSFANFVHATILRLLEAAREEATRLGAALPTESLDESSFTDPVPRRHLPHDVDDRVSEIAEGEVPVVANLFLQFADRFDTTARPSDTSVGAIKEFVETNCADEQVRRWEAAVYVIQRKYDTLVKNTAWDSREEDLRALRGHVSMVLHHIELLRYLGHFVEHLDGGVKYEAAGKALGRLIDRDALLRHTYHYAYEMTLWYVNRGREIARLLLERYTRILEMKLELPSNTILHARPASLIVGVVHHYGTPVTMRMGSSSCDASSIMQVMMTIGNHPEERVVAFRGDEKPLGDLRRLFESNLGEDGLDALPEELAYLRPGLPSPLFRAR